MAIDAGFDPTKYMGQTAPPPEEADGGFGDTVELGLRGVLQQAPMQAAATVIGAFQGREGAAVGEEMDAFDRFVAEADTSRDEYNQDVLNRIGDGFGSEMLRALPDLGYSAASIPVAAAGRLAGAGAGSLVAPGVGTAAGWVGGMLAAEQAMSRSQEYREAIEYLNAYERQKGSPLTPEEAAKVKEDMKSNIVAAGKYESIPEAIGAVVETAILGKLFRGGGKGGLLRRGFRGAAQTAAIELPGETITGIGQQQTREGTILDSGERVSFLNPMDVARSAREALPGVLTVGGGVATLGTAGDIAVTSRIASNYAKQFQLTPEERKTISNRALREKGVQVMKFNMGANRPEGQLPLNRQETLEVLQGKEIADILEDRGTVAETQTQTDVDRRTAETARADLEAVADSLGIPTVVSDPDTGVTNPVPSQELAKLIETRQSESAADSLANLQQRAFEMGIPLQVEEGVFKRNKDGGLKLNSKGEPIPDKRVKTAEELQAEIEATVQAPEGGQLDLFTGQEGEASAFGLRGLLDGAEADIEAQTQADANLAAPGGVAPEAATPAGQGALDFEAAPEGPLAQEGDIFAESTGAFQPASQQPGTIAPATTPYDVDQAYEAPNYEETGAFRGPDSAELLTDEVVDPGGFTGPVQGTEIEAFLEGTTTATTPQDRQRLDGHVQAVASQVGRLEAEIADIEGRITLPGFRDALGQKQKALAEAKQELARARKAKAKSDRAYFERRLNEQAASEVDKAIVESDEIIDKNERKRMIAARKKEIRELLKLAETDPTAEPGAFTGFGQEGERQDILDALAQQFSADRARQWFKEQQGRSIGDRQKVAEQEEQLVLDILEKPKAVLGGQPGLFDTAEGVGPQEATPNQRALAARRRRQQRAQEQLAEGDRKQRRQVLNKDIDERGDTPAPQDINGDTAASHKAAIAAERVAYDKRTGEYAPTYGEGDFTYSGGTVPTKEAQAREDARAERLFKRKTAKMRANRYKATIIKKFLDEGRSLNEFTVAPLDSSGKIWGIVPRENVGEGDPANIEGTDVYFDIAESQDGSGWTVTPQGTPEQIREFEKAFPNEDEARQYQKEMNDLSFGEEATTVPESRRALELPKPKRGRGKGKKATKEKPAEEKKETQATATPEMDLLMQAAEKLGIEVPLKKKGANKGQPAIGPQALGKLIKERMGVKAGVTAKKAAERALAGEAPASVPDTAEAETQAAEPVVEETQTPEEPVVEEPVAEEEAPVTDEQKEQLRQLMADVGDVQRFLELTGIQPKEIDVLTEADAQDAIDNAANELERAAAETAQATGEPTGEQLADIEQEEAFAAADIPGNDNTPVKGRNRLKILTKARGDRVVIGINGWSKDIKPTKPQSKTFEELGILDADTALDALQALGTEDTAMTAMAVINTEANTVTFSFADAKGATTFNGAFQQAVKKGAFSATQREQAPAAPADLTEVETKMNDFATAEDADGNQRFTESDLRVSEATDDLIDRDLQGLANNIEAETGLKVHFVAITGSMTDKNGNKSVPDGYNDGAGNIYVNVLSGQPGNYLLGHEVAHSLQNTEDFKVFKKALDAAAKRQGIDIGAEGYHDFFGMAMNNAQFWDTAANEANKQGALDRVFEKVMEIFDRVLATAIPELQLSRDYMRARKLAAQAYARYRDRTPPSPGKPEGSGETGEATATEGLSATELDAKRVAVVSAIGQVKAEVAHGRPEEQPSEIEYKAPVAPDVKSAGERLGIQFEDKAELAARDLFNANGYGDEARYLGSTASELKESIRDGIFTQSEAMQRMGEMINNLATAMPELSETLSDISDDMRSQGFAIPTNINSAAWLREFMDGIGTLYDRTGANVEEQNEAMLEAAQVEEAYDLTDVVDPEDLYQGEGEELLVTGEPRIYRPLRGIDYLPEYGRALFEEDDVSGEGFFVSQVIGAMNHAFSGMQGVAERKYRSAKDPSGTMINNAPKWMGALSIPKLIDIFGNKIKRLQPWYNTLKDYTGVRDGALNEFTNTIRPLLTNDKEAKLFSRAAGETTFHQTDPTKTLLEQDWVIDHGSLKAAERAWDEQGWKKTTGHTFAQGYAISLREYKKMAPDTRRIFKQTADQLKGNRQAELKAYEQKVYELTDNKNEREAEMKKVRRMYSQLRGMYFPLGRFGDYFVIAKNSKSGLTDLWAAETVQAAEEIKKDIEASGDYDKVSFSARNPNEALPEAVTQNFLDNTKLHIEGIVERRITEAVKAQAKREKRDLTEAEKKQIAQEVRTEVGHLTDGMSLLWLNSMPSTSAMKNSIRRKNSRGWNEDMIRNVSDYMTRHASNLAALTHGYTLDHELYLMDRELRAQLREGDIDQREFYMRRHLVNHLRRHMDTTRNTPTAGAFGKLATSLASVWYMSSPSAWLVQMSQLGILTLPRLASQHGLTNAIKIMNDNLTRATDSAYSYKNVVNNAKAKGLYERIYETASVADVEAGRAAQVGDLIMSKADVNKAVAALSPRDRQLLALYTAMRKNMVSTTMTNETMELATGRDPSRLMRGALFFMRTGEELSRRTAVLSGFDAEYAKSKDFAKALEYAQEINTKTMFDYSKEAKPAWLNERPALRVITQFQFYTYSMLAHVSHQFLVASFGAGKASKAQRMQAFKELSFMMGTTAALSGAMGMPLSGLGFAVADTVIHAMADDEEEYVFDSKYWFKQQLKNNGISDWMVQVIEEGAPGALDMALSTRTGLAQSFGVGENFTPAQLRGVRYYDYLLARHVGPSFAAMRDIALGMETMYNTGDWEKGMQLASPKIMRDVIKGIRFQQDGGVVDFGGRRWSDEAGSWDTVLLMLGVNPYDYATLQRKKRGLARIDARVQDQHRRMAHEITRGYTTGDTDRMKAGLADAVAFAEKYPKLSMESDQVMRALNSAHKKDLGYGSRKEQEYEALFRPGE